MDDRRDAPSWGRYPRVRETRVRMHWRDEIEKLATLGRPVLACGNRRSYGDSALNDGGIVADFSRLNRFVEFDAATGRLVCESGVTIGEILHVCIPRGWTLPAIPGTRFVTVGGAIANDVHGKNHAVQGSFGSGIERLILWRSREGFTECSLEREPALFSATIGGLGLTGVIVEAQLRLIPQRTSHMDMETVPFAGVEEFLALADESDRGWQYTVAWIDGLAPAGKIGRGVFFRANPADSPSGAGIVMANGGLGSVPFDLPGFVVSAPTVRSFNALYRWTHRRARHRVPLESFFFPLDSIEGWNRGYGRRGFLQHQSVVPMAGARASLEALLSAIAQSGEPAFLSVLKTFGRVASPGMLSFPREGATLAMDFPMRGAATLELLEQLDAIVREAGGAVYPAKDARMSRETFQRSFPRLDEFGPHVDPLFSSSFWRRVAA